MHATVAATDRLTHDLNLKNYLENIINNPFTLEPQYTIERKDELRRFDNGDMRHFIPMNAEMKRIYQLALMMEKHIEDQAALGQAIIHHKEFES